MEINMIPNTVVGQTTGTGAAINVVLGFLPDKVELVNRTTGATLEWYRGAGIAGGSKKTVVAGTVTIVTGAASVAPYESATLGAGFTIPADAQVNVAANVIDYVAIRSGPGAS